MRNNQMTAAELLESAQSCVTCGKIHKPRKTGNYVSWAAQDGHSYRTRLFEMTGDSSTRAIAALRKIAGIS